MILTIDQASSEPLYLQIRAQIVGAIARGDLLPGDKLPSVRTLASDLGVNLHTVNKAYALLRDEGHLVMRGRNGAQVPDFAQAASVSAQTEGDRHMTESLLQLALEHRARGGTAETFVEAAREQARRAFSE
ncbi:MAG: GntR family transcriptional regulator [Eggerthellaceae bacterium]|nr:GntR family transcriptional regulator [Eggerthellaceae bacterium]